MYYYSAIQNHRLNSKIRMELIEDWVFTSSSIRSLTSVYMNYRSFVWWACG